MADPSRLGITELYSGTGPGGDAEPVVTIILVHGLRGHPVKTWEHARESTAPAESGHRGRTLGLLRALVSSEKSRPRDRDTSPSTESTTHEADESVYWPRDLLPSAVPNARILTYGYDADVVGLFQARSKDSISQHAQTMLIDVEHEVRNGKPIIFVAHSLGGIIVKDVLRRSKTSLIEKYRSVHGQTRCIVFLGTPHQGAAIAGWGEIVRNVAAVSLMDSNKRILSSLEPDSEILDNIQSEFMSMLHTDGFKVHSFQEALGVSGVKGVHGKVVNDFSSKLGNPAYEVVESIDANHMCMARFAGPQDSGYRRVSRALQDFVGEFQQQSSYTSFPRLSMDDGRPYNSMERLFSGAIRAEDLKRVSLGTPPETGADHQHLQPPLGTPEVRLPQDQPPSYTARPSSSVTNHDVDHWQLVTHPIPYDATGDREAARPQSQLEASLGTNGQHPGATGSSTKPDLALHTAIGKERSATVVTWLLSHGADVNASSSDDDFCQGIKGPGVTPLHIAADMGLLEICKLLIDAKADPHAHNTLRRTPLHLAAKHGRAAVCKLLIDAGADVHALTMRKATPLHLAAEGGHDTTCALLINSGAPIDASTSDGHTSLHSAAERAHVEALKTLLTSGADKNATDTEGSTPLHYATRKGFLRVLQLLLHVGANPNIRDHQGRAPIHIASEEDKVVMAEELLKNGGDPDLECSATAKRPVLYPLHLSQSGKMTRLLLVYSATPGKAVTYGDGRHYTALMRAAHRKQILRVKALLQWCSADDIEIELDGQTALGIAKERAHDMTQDAEARGRYMEVVDLIETALAKKRAGRRSPPRIALRSGQPPRIGHTNIPHDL
ncbi:MAG: hypothetical protein M1835_000685 [Candelina submexicana]|nr:MAG: hypothetical protein M1835_000685 [Candelina submexicana]